MLLSLSITGIILSAILLYYNSRKFASSVYLGVFFLLISLYGFNQYVVLYSKSVILVSIIFLNIGFLSYLIGPVFYLYVRSVLTDNSRVKRRDLWHALPMFIFFVASLPHIFSPYSYKVEIATRLVQDVKFLVSFKANLLYDFIPVSLVYLSRPLQVIAYSLASLILLVRYLKHKKKEAVLSNQAFMTHWLFVLLGFLFVWVSSHTLLMVNAFGHVGSGGFYTLNLLQILSGIGLSGLLISPFFFPSILYGLPRLPESKSGTIIEGEVSDAKPAELKKHNPVFEPDYLETIEIMVESCMHELQPYLQTECNIAYVSKLILTPTHHLAYYFREVRKQSFNDFRNECRIRYAKKLISEGKADDLTLEAIGLLSGFASRNAFFTTFKKVEGISPGVFAIQIQA